MKNKKKPFKVVHVFIICVAVAQVVLTLSVFGLYFLISSYGESYRIAFPTSIAITIFIIFIITIIVSSQLAKRIFKPVHEIKDAANKVIHGDFNVRLSEKSSIYEIKEFSSNFNVMVKELGNIEMFKEEFIANVSHEFKTPLSVIEGYVMLLQGDISPEEKEEYTSMILQNTEKLSTLTGNILAISKLENRSLPLEKEYFRIDKQICTVMVDFEGMWEEKDMDIDLQLDSVEYYGFRTLLTRVWSNLIQNAIKFSNRGGSLEITCRKEDENVVITFSDKGTGMDEYTQKHIFDKFYQGESSRSTQGNGLGLALVKQIVVLSGGTISVESEPGKGSTFTITLPNIEE